MKSFTLCLSLLVLVACAQKEPEVIEIPVETIAEVEVVPNASSQVFISGMMCEMGCKGTIEKKLREKSGVASFDINFSDSTAVVSFDSTLTNAAEIATAIDEVAGGGLYQASLLNE